MLGSNIGGLVFHRHERLYTSEGEKGHEIYASNEVWTWSVISQMIKVEKNAHTGLLFIA